MRASGYDREQNDFYQEPRWVVDQMLDVERIFGTVYDPACGEGTIPMACSDRGHEVFGSDMVGRGYGWGGVDFIHDHEAVSILLSHRRPVNIITNPPYRDAEAFISRAYELAEHKVVVLARVAFLNGQKRRDGLYRRIPLARVLVCSQRPSIPPAGKGIKASGGAIDFAWFVFERGYSGEPAVKWLGQPKVEAAA